MNTKGSYYNYYTPWRKSGPTASDTFNAMARTMF